MKIVQKFVADDGTEFDDEVDCAAHEEMLPFAALLAQVEEAIKNSAGFADKIEEIGARVARVRRARGELKRTRKPTETPAPAAPDAATPEAPFEAPVTAHPNTPPTPKSQDSGPQWNDGPDTFDPTIDVSVEKLEREGYFATAEAPDA